MAPVALIFTAVSAVVSAIGAITQGRQAAAASTYNATVAEQNSTSAQQQAQAASIIQQENAKKAIGATVAGYGASGITMEGTPLDVLANSASVAERDRQNILYKGQLQAAGYTDQAQLDRYQASNDASNGYMKATGILLSGGTKAYDMSGGGAGSSFDMSQVP